MFLTTTIAELWFGEMYLRCSVAKLSSHKIWLKAPNPVVPWNATRENFTYGMLFYISLQIFHFNTWKRSRYNCFSILLPHGNYWRKKCQEEACLFLLSTLLLQCIFGRYLGTLGSSQEDMYRNEENVGKFARKSCVNPVFSAQFLVKFSGIVRFINEYL